MKSPCVLDISNRDISPFGGLFGMVLLLCAVTWLVSCIDHSGYGPQGPDPSLPNLTHPGIWIANEGAFTQGQASLSFFDAVQDTVYNQVFRAINGRPVGDVLQSISYYDGKAFLVVNNSRKIEVLDSMTFEHITTITGLSSPRQVKGHNGSLYITDLYSRQLIVLDAESYEAVNTIETGGWTEEMILYNNRLFITVQQLFVDNTPGSLKGVLVIDTEDMSTVGFVDLPQGANSMTLDQEGKLWVLCDGGLEEETGGLFRLDPEDLEVERSVYFPSEAYSASRLQSGASGSDLYFILSDPENGLNAYDIFKMPVSATAIPSTPLIDGGGLYIYGLLVDESSNRLFYSDAVGLVQEGFVFEYRLDDLVQLHKFATGIFPGFMISSR